MSLDKLSTLTETESCAFQKYKVSVVDGMLIVVRYLRGLGLSIQADAKVTCQISPQFLHCTSFPGCYCHLVS